MTGGAIGATTLFVLNGAVAWLLYRSSRARRIIEGTGSVLIEHGRVIDAALAREEITGEQLLVAAQRQGAAGLEEVERAVLEPSGALVIEKRRPSPEERAIAELSAKVDALAARHELDARPELREPVLVVAMEGWVDAGLGAAAAVAALLTALQPDVVATFDADTLLDHRARRPIVRIVDGVNTGLVWPEIELRAATPGDGPDVLLLLGPEPDHQWRAFSDAVAELAGAFGVRLVVGLGAFPAPWPHTRPSRLAATATTPELARQVGFVNGTLDVPAGVQAALERRFADLGVPAIGLWARVPHYASAMPYPEAAVMLLDGLAQVAGVSVRSDELRQAAVATRQRLDELIANSEEHTALVRQLEAQVDAETSPDGLQNLPSGDELAAELERFLREQGR